MGREKAAQRLEAVADWFTDAKTLTLENLPKGLITDLRAGAQALRTPSAAEVLQTLREKVVKDRDKSTHFVAEHGIQRFTDATFEYVLSMIDLELSQVTTEGRTT